MPEQLEKCNTSALADVILLVHCRQRLAVCRARQPLLKKYSEHFREVVFLLKYVDHSWTGASRPCVHSGDPHWCIASEMERAKKARGIMYMQFDVATWPLVHFW